MELRDTLKQLALPARKRALADAVREWLTEIFIFLSPEEIGPQQQFIDLGTDSLKAVDFKVLLESRLSCTLRSTLLFDYPRLDLLIDYLAVEVLASPTDQVASIELPGPVAAKAPVKPLAIIGMGCRLPGGVRTPEDYWQLLQGGVDAITEIPESRWSGTQYHDANAAVPGKITSRFGGFLDDIDQFDAQFFGISPREALQLDPQQRLLLETAWETLENAGLPGDALQGREVGVFVGTRGSEYFDFQAGGDLTLVDAYHATGNALSTAAGRLSFSFGWTGPSMAVDTACSSSLVAFHLACESIRNGESELALAAGVNLLLSPISSIGTSKAEMLSADGRCKSFSDRADGYVRSEGCVVMLIKPLEQALADGNPILGVVRGSATNQDGASGGLTVPSGAAQEAVIRKSLAAAGMSAADISHVEAHGTGTALGDPIEVGALGKVFAPGRSTNDPLWLGSVKTNIGHTEPVSGLAGLAKVLLAFQHQLLPQILHCDGTSPYINWEELPLRPLREARPWLRGERERAAGVSSFGFSGSNAHVIVSEPPPVRPPLPSEQHPALLLPLSARSEASLRALAVSYQHTISQTPAPDLAALSASAALGRSHLPWRAGLVFTSQQDLQERLHTLASTAPLTKSYGGDRQVTFLFSGQGSHYAGMGRQLYAHSSVFRATVDRCCAQMVSQLPVDLKSVMWGDDIELLSQTQYTQPALFVFQYALAQLWLSWGIQPSAVVGHSIGEYAAACIAGVFSLEDALTLIVARGRLTQQLEANGKMAVVLCERQIAEHAIADYLDTVAIAARNSPQQQVISGDAAHIDMIVQTLHSSGVRVIGLPVSHAFHSPLMQPMVEAFRETASRVAFHAPKLPLISTVLGQAVTRQCARVDYWVKHILVPVDFVGAIHALADSDIFLEIGPKATLLGLASDCLPKAQRTFVASVGMADGSWGQMLHALATIYTAGLDPDWSQVVGYAHAPTVRLPNYPFDKKRFWFDRPPQQRVSAAALAAGGQLPGQRLVSPLSRTGIDLFSTRLSEQSPAWIGEHRVYGQALLPAAAYLSICLSAARQLLPGGAAATGLSIHAPMIIGAEALDVQTVVSPQGEARSVNIYSARGEDWVLHASAVLQAAPPMEKPDLAALRAACDQAVDVPAFYRNYETIGLAYGPSFRCIDTLYAGETTAYARINLRAGFDVATGDAHIHPVLLDACFQSLRAARIFAEVDSWLPLGCATMYWIDGANSLGQRIDCYSTVHTGDGGASKTVDLYLTTENGVLLAVVGGLQLVRASAKAFLKNEESQNELLYQLNWQEQALASVDSDSDRSRSWLVLANQGAFSTEFFQILNERAVPYDALYAGDFSTTEAFVSVLNARLAAGNGYGRVVSLWATANNDFETPVDATWLNRMALGLVQTVGITQPAPTLCFVTEHVFGDAAQQDYVSLQRATLWGLARTIQLEQPQLHCRVLDVSGGHCAADAESVYFEIRAANTEGQVSYRDGKRRVARLQHLTALKPEIECPAEAFDIRVSAYGDLDYLQARTVARRLPRGSEVEIEVFASALNFKDVLHALGVLAEFSRERGIALPSQQDFGFEAAGRIVAVGPKVKGLNIGDEVLVSTPGCLASHVLADQSVVMKKPATLGWTEAAAIQTVFLTGLYGLQHLAQLKAGERVLIHAAAGGVGQAALQIARACGAEIFATASPGKWAHLQQQGVQHIMNSRDLDFADEIKAMTGGEGVDVVLNSLNGDFISKSLSVLKTGGRFVEIGKKGIWTAEQMQQARPDVRYFSFDMGDVAVEEPVLYAELQAQIVESYASGRFSPLPVVAFPVTQLKSAFRHLAQARNIGKVVVTFAPEAEPGVRIRDDASYVFTGGFGGLGLLAARCLIDQGAHSIALIARGQPNASALAFLEEQQGRADVRVYVADLTQPGQLQQAFAAIENELPPIAGVLHCAGALADGTLQTQSADRFVSVLPVKVDASWQLHQLTASMKLDFFVCYSSVVSLLGGVGQANYGAANAFMDALAAYRRGLGLPGTSIQWGPWAEVGMAAALAERNEARFAAMGMTTIKPEQGMSSLIRLLDLPLANVAVMDVNWDVYRQQLPHDYPADILENLLVHPQVSAEAAVDSAAVRERLQAASSGERKPLLNDFLLGQLAAVLGFASGDDIGARDRLFDLGIDSLLAVSLKTRIESALHISLPTTLVFDYPTVDAISSYLLGEMFSEVAVEKSAAIETITDLNDHTEEGIAWLLQQALEQP